ncbi:MAG TPA: DNA adenine methylase [Candidatus Hydrogenedentes bacterium]|nr:DNA adenine methylase [Candidatus Hydrogenedentota bacterium]HPG66748.1 DNA adenine methylase [Candidatus Hydrogenedentota bacterium]
MKRSEKRDVVPRPFLKWVGGKGQLLDELLARVPSFGRYHEPFVGGGALFFELARGECLGARKAYLSDSNPRLVEAYEAVRDHVDEVIALLQEHKARHSEKYYYAVRAEVPESLPKRGARIIYLNKTCFNGLFRENSRGLFNVPFGRYKNPLICDEANLRAVAEALKRAHIESRPFESVLKKAEPGDFVYFDPPYHPVSKTASFTAYERGGFGEAEQRRLAGVFAELAAKGVRALLSNSDTALIRELYPADVFRVEQVHAKRLVNSRADRRGEISELLVSTP